MLGCDLVDRTCNSDRAQQSSNVVAILPVTTESSLSESITNFGVQKFTAPLKNGNVCGMRWFVGDNTPGGVAKVYVSFEMCVCS